MRAFQLRHTQLMAARRALLRRLSDAEKAAVQCYTNLDPDRLGCGFQVNRALRSGSTEHADTVRALDAVFSKAGGAALPPSVHVLYRGVGADAALLGLPQPGTHVTMPTYLSTSHVLPRALFYAGGEVVLRFRVTRHWSARWFYSPNEEEVVLERGTAWRVLAVRVGVRVPRRATVHPRSPLTDHSDHVPLVVTMVDVVPA